MSGKRTTQEVKTVDSYELAVSWSKFMFVSMDEGHDLADGQVQLGYGYGNPRDLTATQTFEIFNYVAYTKIEVI